jgi:hypothetical protein
MNQSIKLSKHTASINNRQFILLQKPDLDAISYNDGLQYTEKMIAKALVIFCLVVILHLAIRNMQPKIINDYGKPGNTV